MCIHISSQSIYFFFLTKRMKKNCLLVFGRNRDGQSVGLIPIFDGRRWIVGQRRQQRIVLVRVLRAVVAGGVSGQPQHDRSLGLGRQSWSRWRSFDIHFVRLWSWSVMGSSGMDVRRWHTIIIILLSNCYYRFCDGTGCWKTWFSPIKKRGKNDKLKFSEHY